MPWLGVDYISHLCKLPLREGAGNTRLGRE